MRVYDWAAAVKDSWFISDGIHFTSAGYAARARLIAQALATGFPADGGAGRRQTGVELPHRVGMAQSSVPGLNGVAWVRPGGFPYVCATAVRRASLCRS